MANLFVQTSFSNPWGAQADELLADESLSSPTGQAPNTISETPAPSPFGMKDIMGSIGSAVRNIGEVSRDIGTAVGTAQGAAKTAEVNYQAARGAAADPGISGKLRQWWIYSSTNDKIVAGLALAAVAIGVIQLSKR
jgi:hypothetical protein